MSIASMKKRPVPFDVAIEKYVPPTDLHVNLKKFKDLNGYEIGHECEFQGKGKITNISKSEDTATMTIEITSLKKKKGQEGDDYEEGEEKA